MMELNEIRTQNELMESRTYTNNNVSHEIVSDHDSDILHVNHVVKRKTTLSIICIAGFLGGCSFSLMAPFMPQEAKMKGLSSIETGIIFSGYQLGLFVTSPFIGNYLTRLGSKFVAVVGLFVCGLFTVIFGLASSLPSGTIFFLVAVICRLLDATGGAAVITSIYAIAVNAFPDHMFMTFGLIQTAMSVGLMVAPVIGAVLYQAGSFWLPFFVVGALTVLYSVLVKVSLPPILDVKKERQRSMFSLLYSSMVWITNLCIFNSAIGSMFMSPTLALHLKQFHMSTTMIGLMFVITPVTYGLSAPLWGYISDKQQEIHGLLVVFGNLMAGAGVLLIGPSPMLSFLPSKIYVIGIGLAMLGMFNNCGLIQSRKCLHIAALDTGFEDNLDTQGVVSGMFNSVYCLGAFVGPILSGAVVEGLGFQHSTTVFAGFFFVSSLSSSIYYLIQWIRVYNCRKRTGHTQYERLSTKSVV